MPHPRLLVAGIGNVFHGDDAFGVQVARSLARRALPDGVNVRDFGIRGFDLALALTDGYDGAILIDATLRGGAAGTLYVIEPELPGEPTSAAQFDPHGLDPVKVLRFARTLGEVCPWVRVVGCEPLAFGTEDDPAGLSEPVARAVEPAAALVETLAGIFLDNANAGRGHSRRPCTNSG